MPKIAPSLKFFAPENWGELDKFVKFHTTVYQLKAREARALEGVSGHFRKACILESLCVRLRPGLDIEEQELHNNGFTNAAYSTELATVFESAILEAYSCVDCLIKSIKGFCGHAARKFPDSTRGTFQKIDSISGIPEEVRSAIREWEPYPQLMELRDMLVHFNTGHVGLGDDKTVYYRHFGIVKEDGHLYLPDAFGWLRDIITKLNNLLGAVFRYYNSTLSSAPQNVICGMVEGRALVRWVNPLEKLTFDSGYCGSRQWIDLPDHPSCPFKQECKAYDKAM
ncbi:hypothetical protein ACSV5S_10990 [Agrobacterium deltaense]|uniref:hypothetical protein n=1 Tax=Agrobacterium deltaense TaxID=1183412 RepID=UPI003FD24C9A